MLFMWQKKKRYDSQTYANTHKQKYKNIICLTDPKTKLHLKTRRKYQ